MSQCITDMSQIHFSSVNVRMSGVGEAYARATSAAARMRAKQTEPNRIGAQYFLMIAVTVKGLL